MMSSENGSPCTTVIVVETAAEGVALLGALCTVLEAMPREDWLDTSPGEVDEAPPSGAPLVEDSPGKVDEAPPSDAPLLEAPPGRVEEAPPNRLLEEEPGCLIDREIPKV